MERCTQTRDAFESDDDEPEAWAARRVAERIEHKRALWRAQGARKRAKKKAAREAAANPAANPGPRAEQDDRQLTLPF